jgi:hypothetical protein
VLAFHSSTTPVLARGQDYRYPAKHRESGGRAVKPRARRPAALRDEHRWMKRRMFESPTALRGRLSLRHRRTERRHVAQVEQQSLMQRLAGAVGAAMRNASCSAHAASMAINFGHRPRSTLNRRVGLLRLTRLAPEQLFSRSEGTASPECDPGNRPQPLQPRAGSASALLAMPTLLFSLPTTWRR